MPQTLTQTQTQRAEQQLRLSQQQLQLVRLLEMPIAEFEQQVKKELIDNPALEEGAGRHPDDKDGDTSAPSDETDINDTGIDPYGESDGSEEGRDTLGDLAQYGDDDLPVYTADNSRDERLQLPLGDGGSFIGFLEAQMMNYDLTDDQRRILTYLIGSLDNRGFIDRSLESLADELAFKEYLYVSPDEVEHVLRILQSFDPPGIGARSTQECLLLQIDRLLHNEEEPPSPLKQKVLQLERNIIGNYYDLFINKNKERLKNKLSLSTAQIDALFDDIRRLNVNPGFALGEGASDRVQTQIPDFIVETDPNGSIEMRLNNGEVPRLHVSHEFLTQLQQLQAHPNKMTRGEKEGMLYTRQKIETAQMFIESVKQRRRTLYETMKAIIDLQRTFFLTKDEDDKVRLVLDDVAKRTGYDVSTISRVCSSKCALVDGHIYPLSDFFKLTRKNAAGEEVDGRQVKALLRDIIDHEDKQHPYADDQIVGLMKQKGITLARRTIAKYRTELGIPPLNDRKG